MMGLLILRNVARRPLRTTLTVLGLIIALFAFVMIRTMVNAFYAGVERSSVNRLITRSAVSLVFYLPVVYQEQIATMPGVKRIARSNWFGGVYIDERNRFAQFAVDEHYLDLYPEYILSPAERAAWEQDRTGAIIGAELAERLNLTVGQKLPLRGTIFPGEWDFTIRGIFRGRDDGVITRTMFFHWDYLNERNKVLQARTPDQAGVFIIEVAPGVDAAKVAAAIDERYKNSFAETLTESESSFAQSFVSLSSNIVIAIDVISIVVLVIMLLVLTNTMILSVRERLREYAILKAIGFSSQKIATVIVGESVVVALIALTIVGVALAVIFSLPPKTILGPLIEFFPIFRLAPETVVLTVVAALAVAIIAALPPTRTVARLSVAEGVRE